MRGGPGEGPGFWGGFGIFGVFGVGVWHPASDFGVPRADFWGEYLEFQELSLGLISGLILGCSGPILGPIFGVPGTDFGANFRYGLGC